MQSSGGVAPAGEAAARRRLERALGPRRRRGRRRRSWRGSPATATRVGLDMGGTSCDVCVVEDGARAAHRLARDRRPGDPAADGRRPHRRRRRRLDRLARRAAARCASGRSRPGRARARLLRPRRHRADGHRRESAAGLPGRRARRSPAAWSSTSRRPRARSARLADDARARRARDRGGHRPRRQPGDGRARCAWSPWSAGSTRAASR